MMWLNLSLGQRRALENELSKHADESYRDLDPSKGFCTREEMKEHIERIHEAIDSIPDWRRDSDEKVEWHASVDGTTVKGIKSPTGEDLPDMKTGEYVESED